MTPQDLADLHARCTDRPWSVASFASALTQAGTILYADQTCFALGRVILDEAELLHIATLPEHQRQGLGRRALSGFEAQAQAQGAVRGFLEVAAENQAARALYHSAGWQQDGLRRGYYPATNGASGDAVLMSKTL